MGSFFGAILGWLASFFTHKQRDEQREAAADHVAAQVENTELEEAKNAQTVRASLDDASDAERMRRESRWFRPD